MSARIQGAIDYVTNYRQVNQYVIISTLSNSTFRIALWALSLLFYLRVNAKLLRHLKRQSIRQRVQTQKKGLYDESIENSSFTCSKYGHNEYYGVINKLGMDTNWHAKWSWHIYPNNDWHHDKRGDVTTSIDGSGHENSTGPLVCKIACIKHIESKGYRIEYVNEWHW